VYLNGRENGKFKVWHYNRQLMRVETLSNGRRTGTSFVYDASGNVIEKKTYK
jgi:antitoxin component YwqK of YwqJK toxin-antitoxin module